MGSVQRSGRPPDEIIIKSCFDKPVLINEYYSDQLHHTIRKFKFLSKNLILTRVYNFLVNQSCQQLKSANPQHFHEFFTQNVFDNFSREIKVIKLKSPKPQYFREFSPQKKSTIFLGKSKLNFWTKNEDFEQCDLRRYRGCLSCK